MESLAWAGTIGPTPPPFPQPKYRETPKQKHKVDKAILTFTESFAQTDADTYMSDPALRLCKPVRHFYSVSVSLID